MSASTTRVFLFRLAVTFSSTLILFGSVHELSAVGNLPGVIPPSACRVGAVLSTDQVAPLFGVFAGLGRSNIRTALVNDEVVAGTWVIFNNFVPDTSIKLAPNCAPPLGASNDGAGLNLMGVRITTTISSPQKADIESIKLIWDVNANGLWDPLLDLVLQEQPGEALLQEGGALFTYGPQQPLATLSSNFGPACNFVGAFIPNAPPAIGAGPVNGTNTTVGFGVEGCYIALLAVAKIGDMPIHRTKFGLQLEAYAGDIPGTSGVSSFTVSSGFSSSRNPQASNVWVDVFGGLPGPETPFDHLNHGIGNPQNSFQRLIFRGADGPEGLVTRFRANSFGPGTRELVLFAGGLCDGGVLANNSVLILPPVAGAPPTIAGSLGAIPCVVSAGTDGIPTAVISLILRVNLPEEMKKLVGTVRLYADLDCDGVLFEPGELIQSRIGYYNEPTNDTYVHFNEDQVGFILTPGGVPLTGGCPAIGGVPGVDASPFPLILILTGDINSPEVHGQGFGPYLNEYDFVTAQDHEEGHNDSDLYVLTPGGNSQVCPPLSSPTDVGAAGSTFDPCLCVIPAAGLNLYQAHAIRSQGYFDPCEGFYDQTINPESNELRVSAQRLHNSIRFALDSAPSRFARAEVFDMKGHLVFRSSKENPYQLIWNLRDRMNRPVANGIYLYLITAYRSDGTPIRSEVKKLVVMR